MDFGMSQSDMESIQGGLDPSGATGGTTSDFSTGDPSFGDDDYTVTGAPTQFRTVENYTQARGATATNPFPDSIFSRIFGAENVDYSNILNTPGGYTPAGINQLRFDQSQNPGNFKQGDFYIGQDTVQGQVKEMPRSGIMNAVLDNVPYLGAVRGMLGVNTGMPEFSKEYQGASAKAEKSQGELTDLLNSALGVFSSSTGQRAVNDMRDNVDMNNRTFDAFGDRLDTRQIGNFSQEGAEIPNFMTNPVAQIPVVDTLARQSFFPRPMDPPGYFRKGDQLRTLRP